MRARRANDAQVNGGSAIEVDSSSDHGIVQGQEHESIDGTDNETGAPLIAEQGWFVNLYFLFSYSVECGVWI